MEKHACSNLCCCHKKYVYDYMHEKYPVPLHQQRVQCGHTWLNLCGNPGQRRQYRHRRRRIVACPACTSSALTKGVGILRFPNPCGLSTVVHPGKLIWNPKMGSLEDVIFRGVKWRKCWMLKVITLIPCVFPWTRTKQGGL